MWMVKLFGVSAEDYHARPLLQPGTAVLQTKYQASRLYLAQIAMLC